MAKHAQGFTQHTVSKAKPKSQPYELRDGHCKGLILRVQESGTKNWYVVLKSGKRFKIGPADLWTLTDARVRAEKFRFHNGEPPDEKQQEAVTEKRIPTLGEFLGPHKKGRGQTLEAKPVDPLAPPTYRDYFKASHVKAQAHLNNFNVFEEYFKTRLDFLSKPVLDKWITARLNDGVSKATLKRNVGALKTALRQAVEWGLIPASPLATYKPSLLKGADEARTRYLNADEEKRLLAALKKSTIKFQALVLLALNTGARQGQLLKIVWRDLDLRNGMLTLRPETAKSKRVNYVPLNAKARKALHAWRRTLERQYAEAESEDGRPRKIEESDAVFAGNTGKHWVNVNGLWNAVKAEAKLEDFTFHDLRHTFASRLVQRGEDLYVVQRLLGHSDPKLTARYAHHQPDALKRAVEKL